MTPIRPESESRLIASFARAIDTAGVRPKGLVAGVGDDAAIFRVEAGRDTVVTQDVLVEGRHFAMDWFNGFELGWRVAAVNLSDMAAMGARPSFALFSLILPRRVDGKYVRRIERGIVAHLSRFGAALIGGNISGTHGPLSCDLTLIGSCKKNKAWRRTARPGDLIIVAGSLGEAAAGLDLLRTLGSAGRRGRLVNAYVKPRPLLDVSDALSKHACVRGAIDVSDGLSTDLLHMCETAGVGCEIDGRRLPVSRPLSRFCRDRRIDPIDWIMTGGEDYALILSVPPLRETTVHRHLSKLGHITTVLGRFTSQAGKYLLTRSGGTRSFRATGWDHLQD